VEGHDRRLTGEIVVQLVVSDPVEWKPEEDLASDKATADLINPGIIKGHPTRTFRFRDFARLNSLPEHAIVQVLVCPDRVQGPPTLLGMNPELHRRKEDTALWRCEDIFVPAEE